MDKESLARKITEVFNAEKVNGLVIDHFGLAPAYRVLLSNSFVLGVSAPSLRDEDSSTRTRIIFEALYRRLTDEEKIAIDRVRVFASAEELKESSARDFENWGADYRKSDFTPDLHEVA